MPLQPVDISTGQVSSVDDLSQAPSSVLNWEVDAAGINRPRPGLTQYTVAVMGYPAAVPGPFNGMDEWRQYLIAIDTDGFLWWMSDANPTSIAIVSPRPSGAGLLRPVFAMGQNDVYFASGGCLLRWNPVEGMQRVEGAPFSTHVAAIGQRLVVNVTDAASPGSFQWSDIGEPTWSSGVAGWPPENVANAEARPDPLIALFENTNELILMGSQTIQCYGVGADPTFPFEQISTVNTGLAAPYAYARMEENFAFLDTRRRIVMSDGRTVNAISDAIDKDLRNLSVVSDCFMFREERGSFSLLVARFPTAQRTFVHDLSNQKWTERDFYVSPVHTDWPVLAHHKWVGPNLSMYGVAQTTGIVTRGLATPDETSVSDLGLSMVCERTLGWQDFGTTGRKKSSRVRAVMRRGLAAQGATPGMLELRVQNDGNPWSTWKPISMGQPEQVEQVKDLYSTNGIFRRRRYGVRYSSSERLSLVGLYDDVAPLDEVAT